MSLARELDETIYLETREALRDESRWLFRNWRAPRLRTMRQFAEAEIRITTGPHRGRFRCSTQPYSGILFDAIDSRKWNRFFITGPTQSGKTTTAFATPLLYHLFEYCENVVVGLPNMDIAKDLWREKIKPTVEGTRFREFMPRTGAGSQGGTPTSIAFTNGATLRFMTSGGDDKTVSSYTSRILVVTEVDGMDEASENSRETDRIGQLEGRLLSYGSGCITYGECTMSIESGRTNQEFIKGTHTQLVVPCPHCLEWVQMERESLVGWQGAVDVIDAAEQSAFFCPNPKCGEAFSREDRRQACSLARMLHRGQKIGTDGAIEGPVPRTDTLGFRWNAFHNLFWEPGDIGKAEWKAKNQEDEENSEKALCQFFWANPHKPSTVVDTPLESRVLMHRMGNYDRKQVPAEAVHLVAHVDIAKRLFHYTIIAWKGDFTGWVVDHGVIETKADQLGEAAGVLHGLKEFQDICAIGWHVAGGMRTPDACGVDSGWQTKTVYEFIKQAGPRWKPMVGRGFGQRDGHQYHAPKLGDKDLVHLGDRFHYSVNRENGVILGIADSDHWKSFTHDRLAVPSGAPGSLVLFKDEPRNHTEIAKHWTSERSKQEYDEYRGFIQKWEPINSRPNHLLDATYNCCVLGYYCGARLIQEVKPIVRQEASPAPLTMPDGRPFCILER